MTSQEINELSPDALRYFLLHRNVTCLAKILTGNQYTEGVQTEALTGLSGKDTLTKKQIEGILENLETPTSIKLGIFTYLTKNNDFYSNKFIKKVGKFLKDKTASS